MSDAENKKLTPQPDALQQPDGFDRLTKVVTVAPRVRSHAGDEAERG